MWDDSRTCAVHRKRRPSAEPFALLAMALCVMLAGFAANAQQQLPELSHELTRLPEPVPAPAFTLEDMDGERHSLSDYRGKVVMLNFWATWCPPCRREMPSLERLYQSLSDEPFVVLAVNQFEDPDLVFAYMGQLNVFPTFPILFDPDSSIAEDYGVKGLPTTVLIDQEGRVRYRAIGGREFDHPEVEATIRDLIDEDRATRQAGVSPPR